MSRPVILISDSLSQILVCVLSTEHWQQLWRNGRTGSKVGRSTNNLGYCKVYPGTWDDLWNNSADAENYPFFSEFCLWGQESFLSPFSLPSPCFLDVEGMGVGLPVLSFSLLSTRWRMQVPVIFQASFSDMGGSGDMGDQKFPEKQISTISRRNIQVEE